MIDPPAARGGGGAGRGVRRRASRRGRARGRASSSGAPARRFGHALFREVLDRELAEARAAGAARPRRGRARAARARAARRAGAPCAGRAAGAARSRRRAFDPRRGAGAGAASLRRGGADAGPRPRRGDRRGWRARRCRRRLLLALGEARIRRGDAVAGKEDCRAVAVLARSMGDAELGARAALTYGGVFRFGVVDPVLVGMLEESLELLPPGDSALRARLMARLAAALQPSPTSAEPVALAREAIAIARRLGDAAALLDTLYAAVSALMDIVDVGGDAGAEPRGRAARLGRRRSRAPAADAPSARRLSPRRWRDRGVRRAPGRVRGAGGRSCGRRGTAGGRGMLRAVRATMEGRFADADRLAAAGARRRSAPPATRPSSGSGSRTANRGCAPPIATKRCSRGSRRGAARARSFTSRRPGRRWARRSRTRVSSSADEARLHARAAAGVISPAGRQHLRAVLRRRGGGVRGHARSGADAATSASCRSPAGA